MPGVQGQLERDIATLRRIVGRAGTKELASIANAVLQSPPHQTTTDYGLESPARQMAYLLGLAMTTPEPHAHAWDDGDLGRAFQLLQRIYGAYVDMQRPAPGEASPEVERQWKVVAPAFISYFFSSVVASAQQLLERAHDTLVPFDADLRKLTGVTASEAIRVVEWIAERIQRQLDAHMTIARITRDLQNRAVAESWSSDRVRIEFAAHPAIRAIDADADLAQVRRGHPPLHVTVSDLRAAFGAGLADAFITLFASHRRGGGGFTYPTTESLADPSAENPFERAPLLAIGTGPEFHLACPSGHQLAAAVLEGLGQRLAQSAQGRRYYRERDRALERRVTAALVRAAGGSAFTVAENLAETPTGQFEHDNVVILDHVAAVVEAKAGRLRGPRRDPARAFPLIRDDFRADGSIQKGFEQGERIRRAVLVEGRAVPLYKKGGAEVLRLEPGDVTEVLCACITAEEYGMLAADLSLLLEKPAEAPYPWAANIYDLEALVEAFALKGWGIRELFAYLRVRQSLHGWVIAADELEIGAVFLLYGSLAPLVEILDAQPGMRILMAPDSAWVFDEIYLAVRGGREREVDLSAPGPLEVTPPVEGMVLCAAPRRQMAENKSVLTRSGADRNRRCPCGSRKKYKHCHGR